MKSTTIYNENLISTLVQLFKRFRSSGIARRGLTVFVIQVLGVVAALLSQILVARFIGEDQYGLHAYVISWSFILLLSSVFGMDTVALRFFSSYMGSKSYAKVQGLVRFSRIFVFGMSVLTVTVAFAIVVMLYLQEHITTNEAICYAIGLISIPFAAQMNLNLRLLWACNKAAFSKALTNILRPSLVVLIVILAYFLVPYPLTALESLTAYAIATFAVVTIGVKVIRLYCQKHYPHTNAPEYEISVWLKTALPLLLASSFRVVMTQCSIIMVGYYLGYTLAGFYFAATRMVGLVAFGLTATNSVVAPMISSAYASGHDGELKQVLRSGARTIFVLTMPLVIALLAAGGMVLELFGKNFPVAYPALAILCIGQAVNSLCGCTGLLMTMTGQERTVARVLFATALLNIVLNAILIPLWGLQGAATATATSLVVWNLWMLAVVWKRMGMDPSVISCLSRS